MVGASCEDFIDMETICILQRLASISGILWAISSDHQVYVFVPKRDVPIRVREELYENEVIINDIYNCNNIRGSLKSCLIFFL